MEELKYTIERKKLSELNMAPYNPRTITDEALEGLDASIKRFGLLAYIVWNKRTGNIVGGHQRCKTLLKNGEEETDVVVIDIHPSEEVALNLALNSKHIRGDYSQKAIEELRVIEAQAGQVFEDLKLDKLLSDLESKKKKPKPKNDKPMDFVDGEPLEEVTELVEPVVVCPKCKSKWLLKDNTVVEDNFTGKDVKNGK